MISILSPEIILKDILSRSATYLKLGFYRAKLIPKIERALVSYLMNLKKK